MSRAGRVMGAALAWALLLFTLAAAVCGIAGDGGTLGREMLRFAPPERTGLPEAEYDGVGRMTAGYLTGGEETFQYVFTDADGTLRACFQDHEAAHMRDVRDLISLAASLRRICGVSAPVLLVAAAVVPGLRRPAAKGAVRGLVLFAAALTALAVWGLADFDGLFTAFHRVAFTNDGWLLDPRTDLLIRLMPTEFFAALAARCLLWLPAAAAVIGMVSYEVCRIIPPAGGRTEKTENGADPGAGNQL